MDNLQSSTIGTPTPRIDGPLKVSGNATYASDGHFPGMLYAVPVCSTIANGRILSLDLSAAGALPGVRAIYHHNNTGPVFRTAPSDGFYAYMDEKRPPFEDEIVRSYGQYVAVAIADTFEQAQAAAHAVKVTYSEEKADVRTLLSTEEKPKEVSSRGNSDAAFNAAPAKVDYTYVTPVETHNPIELHASIAVWDGERVTLYETSQAVVNHSQVLAQMLGVPNENVKVISKFLGSGFGGKLWPWPHSILTAVSARKMNRPVKLVVSRKMMFQNVGHRPRTQQRVRLSATLEGKLTSLQQDYLNHTSIQDDYEEDCGEATTYLYSTPSLRVTSGLARRNVGTPTSMRGPGAVPGLFAIESAMDELALKLRIDPVEFRLRNEPEKDESNGMPFSSRHLKECFTAGAQKFGWSKRTPEIGSMKRDGLTLGWGTAACSWIAARIDCQATVDLKADGTVRVACGTQDIGTGTYTAIAQVVNHCTGIPLEMINVVLGDSSLPPGPISGGSWTTASMIPAVSDASRKAVEILTKAASQTKTGPFAGVDIKTLTFTNGRLHVKDKDPSSGTPFVDLLKAANLSSASGTGKSEGTFGNPNAPKFSMHSYGAHFIEVTWQPEIARLRVNRIVSTIDAGRILNPRAGRNQIEGAIVMGIGMALFEETIYDGRNGAPINSNLADYVMPVHADMPEIDVTFLDYPDTNLNELGARGIGEIGLAGIAPAICAAVHHATGIRVRELPVKIENLLST
jgi:xanthine dehydrogenase YagR molybdenum-binding subunit